MKSIVYFTLSVCLVMSCSRSGGSNSTGNESTPQIKDFLSKLNVIPVEYKYDLALQDGENCYQTSKTDSLYFPEYISVVGFFSDTSSYYNILYLEPGDDLYPSIRVFSKSGKLLDSKIIAYGDCASGDCGIDSCVSYVRIIDKSSVERSLLMISTKCDSLGNKISEGEASSVKKNQTITVNSSGRIEFGVEKLD